ncbi:uncharacterized protein TNCT_311261 [Trichonephila clavata]|uniref:Uncharacterized protein n=1 Tax=Trichonephila clavata TaxID=2740835 RepID=A0A8X6HDI9_TRICU|nr:uncharacterized protein TNCT_311261 [Trichonephila clavata]
MIVSFPTAISFTGVINTNGRLHIMTLVFSNYETSYGGLEKWVVKRPPVTGKFKAFKKTAKNVKHLQALVKKNKALQGVVSLHSGSSVCKVKSLSCCQPEAVDKVPYCPDQQTLGNPCNGYNEDVEKTCCRLCDCQYNNCLPHQKWNANDDDCRSLVILCSRNDFSVWSGFMFLVPWLMWVVGTGIALLVVWIAWNVYKKTD